MDKDYQYMGNPNLKKVGVKIPFGPEELEEYSKCVKDPIYFIKNYIKIIHVDHGVVPFEMWDFQENMVRNFHENRYNIVRCSRQSGKTTSVISYLLWCVLFNKKFEVAVLANKEKTAIDMVSRMQMSYEHLPLWMQQGVKTWNKGSLELENGSKVVSGSTTGSAARGSTRNIVYLDEFAFIPPAIQEEFYTSVYPIITSGKTTKMIITSTPNGMDLFYKMWKDSEEGRNDYVRSEMNWWDVPGRDEAWREEVIRATSERQFDQEYGCAFLGSSSTLISGKKLATLTYSEPIHQTEDGFKFYEKADRSKSYIMVVDTARGTGLDYSAFVVFDTTETPFKVVCTFRNNDVHTIVFPKYIMEAATYYNDCYILVETNDLGQQVVDILHYDMEYDGLITTATRTKRHEATSGFGVKSSLGVKTTKTVKRTGCSTFKSMVETDQLVINDFNLLGEMYRFSLKGTSYEASEGNDDLVMCCVLFAWLSTQPYFKDMTGTDVAQSIYRIGTEEMDEYMTPFGVIDTGRDSHRSSDGEDLWEEI